MRYSYYIGTDFTLGLAARNKTSFNPLYTGLELRVLETKI